MPNLIFRGGKRPGPLSNLHSHKPVEARLTRQPPAKRLAVGDSAPDFTLKDSEGDKVSLRDFRGRNVVLFFYPKDESRGCTAQACAFRDAYEDFLEAGADVLGISSDSVASHERFSGRHALPYRLLSDEGGKLRKRFGVPKTLGLLDGRVTYVIDKEGIVRHMFSSQALLDKHVSEALEVLKRLA